MNRPVGAATLEITLEKGLEGEEEEEDNNTLVARRKKRARTGNPFPVV